MHTVVELHNWLFMICDNTLIKFKALLIVFNCMYILFITEFTITGDDLQFITLLWGICNVLVI